MPADTIIAVVNEKGGTAKTTTTVNLAAALGELGQKVLVVDLDGQAASSRWMGVEEDNRLADAIVRGGGLEPIPDVLPGVSLAPASGKLDSVSHELRPTQGGQLRKVLTSLKGYDFIFIDSPPSLSNKLIGNALLAATHVIVPVETSILALDGLRILLATLDDVRSGFGHEIVMGGVLACRFDARTKLSRLVLAELRRALPGKVFDTVVRENVRMRECPASGQSILSFAPDSHAAEDYRTLAKELLTQPNRWRKPAADESESEDGRSGMSFRVDSLRDNAAARVRESARKPSFQSSKPETDETDDVQSGEAAGDEAEGASRWRTEETAESANPFDRPAQSPWELAEGAGSPAAPAGPSAPAENAQGEPAVPGTELTAETAKAAPEPGEAAEPAPTFGESVEPETAPVGSDGTSETPADQAPAPAAEGQSAPGPQGDEQDICAWLDKLSQAESRLKNVEDVQVVTEEAPGTIVGAHRDGPPAAEPPAATAEEASVETPEPAAPPQMTVDAPEPGPAAAEAGVTEAEVTDAHDAATADDAEPESAAPTSDAPRSEEDVDVDDCLSLCSEGQEDAAAPPASASSEGPFSRAGGSEPGAPKDAMSEASQRQWQQLLEQARAAREKVEPKGPAPDADGEKFPALRAFLRQTLGEDAAKGDGDREAEDHEDRNEETPEQDKNGGLGGLLGKFVHPK